MLYDDWKFLYPPRPESAIHPKLLTYYEGRGWLAQCKKNGTNTLLGIAPDGTVYTRTRHDTEHKAWTLTPHIEKFLQGLLPRGQWYVLCAELLHSKTKTIKDTIFIHDVLVWESQFLVGSTFAERQLLLKPWQTNVEGWSHFVLDSENKVWLAKTFDKNFTALFEAIRDPSTDEGLVLKDPTGKLKMCLSETDNASWSVKCRYPTKTYNY